MFVGITNFTSVRGYVFSKKNMEKTDNHNNIRKIVLNSKDPLIIKDQMKCDLTLWNLDDWNKALGNESLQFRCGKNQYTEEPQWESSCSKKEATFNEFLKHIDSDVKEWWYFDYKYLCQWFTDNNSLNSTIDWSTVGFPDINFNDSTIWIGSKGAHTSCHMDTYGCNIVLQILGRKQWILFPPEQNLKPTRVPFEESSVYSKLNFFSPNVDKFKGISHCYKVILNPGEVLVVPNKWWHYVENLDTAISINTWLPLPQDDFQRIKEAVATIFVGKMAQNRQEDILNPNMIEEMITCEEALKIINASKESVRTRSKVQKMNEKVQNIQTENIDQLLIQYPNIFKIPELSNNEFKAFLSTQSNRFTKPDESGRPKKPTDCKEIIDFLEVITNDEVLDLIASKLVGKT